MSFHTADEYPAEYSRISQPHTRPSPGHPLGVGEGKVGRIFVTAFSYPLTAIRGNPSLREFMKRRKGGRPLSGQNRAAHRPGVVLTSGDGCMLTAEGLPGHFRVTGVRVMGRPSASLPWVYSWAEAMRK